MAPGEFAVRGSIVDLYPMGSDTPYRLDMFGNCPDLRWTEGMGLQTDGSPTICTWGSPVLTSYPRGPLAGDSGAQHPRVGHCRVALGIVFEWPAHDSDVGISCKTCFQNAHSQIRTECATMAAAKLHEKRCTNGETQGCMPRVAACHAIDFPLEKLMLDVAHVFELEVLGEGVAMQVRRRAHAVNLA